MLSVLRHLHHQGTAEATSSSRFAGMPPPRPRIKVLDGALTIDRWEGSHSERNKSLDKHHYSI